MGYVIGSGGNVSNKFYLTDTCNKPRIAVRVNDKISYLPMKTTTSTITSVEYYRNTLTSSSLMLQNKINKQTTYTTTSFYLQLNVKSTSILPFGLSQLISSSMTKITYTNTVATRTFSKTKYGQCISFANVNYNFNLKISDDLNYYFGDYNSTAFSFSYYQNNRINEAYSQTFTDHLFNLKFINASASDVISISYNQFNGTYFLKTRESYSINSTLQHNKTFDYALNFIYPENTITFTKIINNENKTLTKRNLKIINAGYLCEITRYFIGSITFTKGISISQLSNMTITARPFNSGSILIHQDSQYTTTLTVTTWK